MRSRSLVALALAGCWLAAHAQERGEAPEQERQQQRPPETAPDLDFLEYLGAWAEEDDEWLAIETWEKDIRDEAGEAPKKSEDERDDDDEGE